MNVLSISHLEFYSGFLLYGFLLISAIILLRASVQWAWKDAEKRGSRPLLVSLFVLLFMYPIGLLIWLILRPSVPNGGTRKHFDLHAYRVK